MESASSRARQFAATAGSIAARAWAVGQEAARATAAHVLRVKHYGQSRWRLHRLSGEELTRRVALGRRMQQLRLGDAALRGQIEQLHERIRSLEAARTSARPVQAELRAAHAALASSAIDQGVAPIGAEVEFEAAQTARNTLLGQQQDVSQSQAALRPLDRRQTLQIGAGYAVASLAFVSALRAWGTFGSATPGPSHDLSPAPGEPVSDGGLPPDVPSTPSPNPAPDFTPTVSEYTCTWCSGAGQADCSACFGTGKRMCYACNGIGTQANPGNNFLRLQCFQCYGTGKQNCSFCQYGKTHCPHCHGTGRLRG